MNVTANLRAGDQVIVLDEDGKLALELPGG